MSDFESFRREAGSQVMPPNFDELVATSRRRRRTAAASAVVAVAAVVSVVAFGLEGVYGDRAAPVPPAGPTRSLTPTPAPTPARDTSPSPDERPQRLTPTQIVNDPNSRIAAVAVSESSTDVKAVAWRFCGSGDGCNGDVFALTVTEDNFITSHDVALPGRFWPTITAVADDAFFVTAGPTAKLVDANGGVTVVSVDETTEPLGPGEVFVGQTANQNNVYLALDPATAVAHPLPTPKRSGLTSLHQNADGTLVGTAYNDSRRSRAVVWSTDGGATWSMHVLGTDRGDPINAVPSAVIGVVPSTAADMLAVVEGGEGAAWFPLATVHRSTDGGATWETFNGPRLLQPPAAVDGPTGDMAHLGWSLVTPDGDLLVNINGWLGQRGGTSGEHFVGLYTTRGADWSQLLALSSLPPSSYPERFTLGDYTIADTGRLQLWVHDNGPRLYQSPGLDETGWAEVPAR